MSGVMNGLKIALIAKLNELGTINLSEDNYPELRKINYVVVIWAETK